MPQHFVGPTPTSSATFREEPITVTADDGKKLAGALTLPNGNITGVALIISGSGPVGMDGDVSGPFLGSGYQGQKALLNLQLAECLAGIEVASLRLDKRGYGEAPDTPAPSMHRLAQDALGAAQMLHVKFPEQKLFLCGLSEGALVSFLVAQNAPFVEKLFLLAPPSVTFDEVLQYQFVDWPLRLLRGLDADQDGWLTPEDFAGASLQTPPLLDLQVSALNWGPDRRLSIEGDLKSFYFTYLSAIQDLMKTPLFSAWYESLHALPDFTTLARNAGTPLSIYQGQQDAQLDPIWIQKAVAELGSQACLTLFSDLGHCFAPMEGALGQIKTSGPLASSLLLSLAQDMRCVGKSLSCP